MLGGGGGLHFCLLSITALNLPDPGVLNCEGKICFEYRQRHWYCGFNMIKGYYGIGRIPILCCGECWGVGKPVVCLLVTASRPREIPMW